MTLPSALRAVLLLVLAGAVLVAFTGEGPAPGAPLVLEGSVDGGDAAAIVRALARGDAPSHVLRTAERAPTLGEAELLEAVSVFAPLTVRAPEPRPLLVPERPDGLVRGRTATLGFHLLGRPDARLDVRLEGEAGAADSVVVTLDAEGAGEGFFRVRPARSGWYDWRMDVAEPATGDVAEAERIASARVGAWARDAVPLRLLVLGGAPTWESRFLVRALEEEGVTVGLHQSVASGLAVVSGVDRPPLSVEELSPWDAVILLPGAPLGPRRLAAIEEHVVERGGGVALAGAGEDGGPQGAEGALARLGLAAGVEPARDVSGTGLEWRLPPEIARLPEEPLVSKIRTYREPGQGVVAAVTTGASAGDGAALLLGSAGRGRVSAVGLRESWRWRMEAGRLAEHREFWRTLGEWLAGGMRDEWRVVPERLRVPVGSTVAVRLLDLDGAGVAAAPALRLRRPGGDPAAGRGMVVGGRATGPTPALDDDAPWTELEVDARGIARFIATEPGVHALALGDDPPTSAVLAVPADGLDEAEGRHEDDASAWARLARAAYASGADGGVVDADSARVLRASLGSAASPGLRNVLPLLLFVLLVSLGVTEWIVRRVRGLP